MQNYKNFFNKINIKNYSFYIFIFLIICSFVITFLLLLPNNNLVKDKSTLLLLLLIDTILVIVLLGLIVRQVVLIFLSKRQSNSASKLHIKFINLFTIISLMPTIGVIIITALFFNLEIRTWYGEAVKSTILNSNKVAGEYLKLKYENLEVDIESISREIFNTGINKKITERDIEKIIVEYQKINRYEDIFIFNSSNKIISFSSKELNTKNFFFPSKEIFDDLNTGKIFIKQIGENFLTAYYKLSYLKDTYLMINENINKTIYKHLIETAKAITAYNNLEKNTSRIQISFSMIFVLFSLCLLLVAILLGFRMAGKLSQPIENLIKSSEKVSKGNFDAKVSEINDSDEMSLLLVSFNKMITEIDYQQKELIKKNVEIENRRLFTEAVLSSLSTGVMALDLNFNITLFNKSIEIILYKSSNHIDGENFFKIFPELKDIKDRLNKNKFNNINKQIEYNIDNNVRNLLIKFTAEYLNNKIIGYVVTIDDLTSLILAEKHAAWSDIARKIAHEIKNPLTPIKLSAERINKKIEDNNLDKNSFSNLTATISSQVDNIGKLIDEFSSFARLPEAKIINGDFLKTLKECFNFYSNTYPNIKFKFNNKENNIICFFDNLQMSMVLNNLTKNAIEAVANINNPSINFDIVKSENFINLSIIDNGIGINKESINKAFKPYFTTKEKGTGLGLSICKKIVEEHKGKILIKKNTNAGSTVILSMRINE